MFGRDIGEILLSLPIVIIALMVHEVSHGFIAMKLGDPTARNLGRLSLNPLKHLDPIGTLCMIFFSFGWAKPVPVNTRYFKKPRRDMALTALAGPVSNLILALAGALLYNIFLKIFVSFPASTDFIYSVHRVTLVFFSSFVFMNISLAVFNLIPVPPLDGSRIFLVFLPAKYYFAVMKYEKYIMLGLLLVLYTGILDRYLITCVNWIASIMFNLVNLIPFLSF